MITVAVGSVDTVFTGVGYDTDLERVIHAKTFYLLPTKRDDPAYHAGIKHYKVPMFSRFDRSNSTLWGSHYTPSGLVPRILQLMADRNVPYQVVSCVPKWEREPSMAYLQKQPISTRDYQTTAVMKLLLPTATPRLGGVEQGATGSGKTRIAARLIQMMQVPTTFFVDKKDLMAQTIREFKELLGCPIGQIGGGKDVIEDINVSTIQTFALADKETDKEHTMARNAKVKAVAERTRLVILDECHSAPANTAQAAMRQMTRATSVVGLSASPWRDDGMDLLIEATCGPVVHKISATELIEAGWLCRPEITAHRMPRPNDPYNPGRNSDQWHEFYNTWVVLDMNRNQYIADLTLQHMMQGDVCIVLVKNVYHGHLLQQFIPHSVFMEGSLGMKERKLIVKEARQGLIPCLIATSLADQGLDIPCANVVILAGGGKSSTKALQRIGRVLRPCFGKTKAYVHDVVDAVEQLEKHYRERLRIYRTESGFEIREKRVAPFTAVQYAQTPKDTSFGAWEDNE